MFGKIFILVMLMDATMDVGKWSLGRFTGYSTLLSIVGIFIGSAILSILICKLVKRRR